MILAIKSFSLTSYVAFYFSPKNPLILRKITEKIYKTKFINGFVSLICCVFITKKEGSNPLLTPQINAINKINPIAPNVIIKAVSSLI
jgi:hypothetical protein